MEYLEGYTNETKRLKETHIYYLQVQLQLLLNKCDYAYFYIYGGGPEREDLCLQIWRKDKFIQEEILNLGTHYFGKLLPAIAAATVSK